jgi:hypothetical protein
MPAPSRARRRLGSSLVAAAVIAAVAAGALVSVRAGMRALWGDAAEAAAQAEHLPNRLWVDRLPKDDRDMFAKLALIHHPDGRVGVINHGSTWRHRIEVFMWALERDRLTLVFPQDRQRDQLQVRTWDCRGKAPAPFELCMELRRGDRKAQFYSRYDWEIDVDSGALAVQAPAALGPVDDAIDAARAALPASDVDAAAYPQVDGLAALLAPTP